MAFDSLTGTLCDGRGSIAPSAIRTVQSLIDAGIVQTSSGDSADRPLYALYQNCPSAACDQAASDSDWRINVTVLQPGTVEDNRYVLTVGHQNAENQTEIHQVLAGTGLFYQQFEDVEG